MASSQVCHGVRPQHILPWCVRWLVVVFHLFVEIVLEGRDVVVEFFTEGDLVKLLQDGFVEAFADAVGLWVLCLGFCVIDIVYGEVELVWVCSGFPQYSVPLSVSHATILKEG